MAGKFSLKKFADINLNDEFFDSLKADYPGKKVLMEGNVNVSNVIIN